VSGKIAAGQQLLLPLAEAQSAVGRQAR